MALKTSVTGDGQLLDSRSGARVYFVGTGDEAIGAAPHRYAEIEETETRQWVALTQAAAEAVRDENIQPDDGGSYVYRVDEANRIVGAYTLTRDYRLVTTYRLPDETEAVATPVFDPPSGEQTDPVTVTVTCATPNAIIKYVTGTGDPAAGADPDTESNTVESGSTVSVASPGWIKAKAYAVGYTSSNIGLAEYTAPA